MPSTPLPLASNVPAPPTVVGKPTVHAYQSAYTCPDTRTTERVADGTRQKKVDCTTEQAGGGSHKNDSRRAGLCLQAVYPTERRLKCKEDDYAVTHTVTHASSLLVLLLPMVHPYWTP
jgi:hypothetical protein